MPTNCTSCDLRLILSPKGLWMLAKETGHEGLDAVGLVPVIGEIADGLNAIWYFAEGDSKNGMLSLAGMVPFAGWASTGAKYGLKIADKFVDKIDDYYKVAAQLAVGERGATFIQVAKDVASHNGWELNKNLMKKNNGRTIYTDPKTGLHYSLDTQHGRFEVLNSKGKHQGEIDFDGRHTKDADTSGKHDIEL